MLALLRKYGAYTLLCTVWSSTLVALCATAIIAVDVVLESGSALFYPLLGLYLCLTIVAAHRLWLPIRAEIWPSDSKGAASPSPTAVSVLVTDETRQPGMDNEQWRSYIEAGFGAGEFARAETEGVRALIDARRPRHLHSPQEHIAPPDSIPQQRHQPPE